MKGRLGVCLNITHIARHPIIPMDLFIQFNSILRNVCYIIYRTVHWVLLAHEKVVYALKSNRIIHIKQNFSLFNYFQATNLFWSQCSLTRTSKTFNMKEGWRSQARYFWYEIFAGWFSIFTTVHVSTKFGLDKHSIF